MTHQQSLQRDINQFLSFAQISNSNSYAQILTSFFDSDQQGEKREVLCDRGQLMMIADDSLVEELSVSQDTNVLDRVIKFDGRKIIEINPYAYLQQEGFQMKGDGSKRGGSAGGTSSNNNNNNNNNG